MWGIIVALISGALMSVQGVFNTGVTKQTSTACFRMGGIFRICCCDCPVGDL